MSLVIVKTLGIYLIASGIFLLFRSKTFPLVLKDLFFHSKELVGIAFEDLREGDKVSFEVGDSPKGPNAVKVSKI